MIRLSNRVLHYADAGPIGATIPPKPALQQANGGKTGYQSAKSGWENRLISAACHHAADSSAHQSPQP